jgi:hypothetical protein
MGNGNGFVVTEESWNGMSEGQRSWITYETMQDMNKRVIRLEKRSIYDKCAAFLGGAVGGCAAVLGIKLT